MPTSRRLATRPLILTRPSLGSVIRDSIFRSVDFPAPLRPMTPTTSPRKTSKDRSLSAQNSSISSPAISCRPLAMSTAERRKSSRRFRHNIPKRYIALPPLMADEIFFAQAVSADYYIAHAAPRPKSNPRTCVPCGGTYGRHTIGRKK